MLFFMWLALVTGTVIPEVSSQNENYPPLWDYVPDNLSDFEIQQKVYINPWDYLERMGLYKVLLNVTAPFLNMNEPDNKKNILWGLPLQHGWQFRTGRLEDTSMHTSNQQDYTSISVNSWWACMNYYLSVIPFLGAIEAGLFDGFPYDIVISQPSESQSDFCYSIQECRSFSATAMDEWKAFFELIKTLNQTSDSSLSKEDRALSSMWIAHLRSLDFAKPRCSKRLSYLSKPESTFGNDWATAVDFIAATNFNTNFQTTNDFQEFLPKRILVKGDKAPNIPDFSVEENKVLVMLNLLNAANTLSGDFLLRIWIDAMCTEESRAAGRNLIQDMVSNPQLTPETVLDAVLELITNSECQV